MCSVDPNFCCSSRSMYDNCYKYLYRGDWTDFQPISTFGQFINEQPNVGFESWVLPVLFCTDIKHLATDNPNTKTSMCSPQDNDQNSRLATNPRYWNSWGRIYVYTSTYTLRMIPVVVYRCLTCCRFLLNTLFRRCYSRDKVHLTGLPVFCVRDGRFHLPEISVFWEYSTNILSCLRILPLGNEQLGIARTHFEKIHALLYTNSRHWKTTAVYPKLLEKVVACIVANRRPTCTWAANQILQPSRYISNLLFKLRL